MFISWKEAKFYYYSSFCFSISTMLSSGWGLQMPIVCKPKPILVSKKFIKFILKLVLDFFCKMDIS